MEGYILIDIGFIPTSDIARNDSSSRRKFYIFPDHRLTHMMKHFYWSDILHQNWAFVSILCVLCPIFEANSIRFRICLKTCSSGIPIVYKNFLISFAKSFLLSLLVSTNISFLHVDEISDPWLRKCLEESGALAKKIIFLSLCSSLRESRSISPLF